MTWPLPLHVPHTHHILRCLTETLLKGGIRVLCLPGFIEAVLHKVINGLPLGTFPVQWLKQMIGTHFETACK